MRGDIFAVPLTEFAQQSSDDAFRFQPIRHPAILDVTPGGFFLNRLMHLRGDIGFLRPDRFISFAEPLHQRLTLGVEFTAVSLQAVFQIQEIAALRHQTSVQFLVIERKSLPRLFDTQPGFFITAHGLSDLCPRLFHREPQFQIGPVRFFEFDSQFVQS